MSNESDVNMMYPPYSATHQKTRKTCNDEDIPSYAMKRRLELKKSVHVQEYLKCACVKSILKHVLFSRGIFPISADQLLKTATKIRKEKEMECFNGNTNDKSDFQTNVPSIPTRKRKRRSDTVRERKYEKHAQQLETMLSSIDHIFQSDESGSNNFTNIKAAMITVGPSFQSPKEQFLIRFHSIENESSERAENVKLLSSIPLDMKKRLENEMAMRGVRELIVGNLQEEFHSMFITKCSGKNSSVKVSVAFLLPDASLGHILNKSTSKKHLEMNTKPAECNYSSINQHQKIIFNVNKRLEVKEPRIYSRSKNTHRPFVVLDIVPLARGDPENVKFEQCEHDSWICLRSFVKGFKT